MKDMFVILFTAMLTDNCVLSKFMGICPFLGVSKKADSAFGMGAAVTLVMVCASVCTYPLYRYFLAPFGLDYLKTVAFVLTIALFVQLIEMVIKKKLPSLYSALGMYLPLITTNCAVLGVTIMNADNGHTFGKSLSDAVGTGLGFTLALLIFSGVRSRVDKADVPETFKGVPASLIAASIVSMSFMCFSGVAEGIFG